MLYPLKFKPILVERVWGGDALARYGKPISPGQTIGETWEISDRPEVQSIVANGPHQGKTLHQLIEQFGDALLGKNSGTGLRWADPLRSRDSAARACPEGVRGEALGAAESRDCGTQPGSATQAGVPPVQSAASTPNGRDARSTMRFPLLVKLLDARETLSIQVHPPATVAPLLRGEPKTEMWYILATAPDAQLYAGLRRGVTRANFMRALEEQQAGGSDPAAGGIATGPGRGNRSATSGSTGPSASSGCRAASRLAPSRATSRDSRPSGNAPPTMRIEDCVHRFPVQPGDAIFIPSGRIHAIGAGLVLVEIQQNSDTTYRVYDWDRVGTDGKPRPLHLRESLASIDFHDVEPSASPLPITCEQFTVEKLALNHEQHGRCDGSTFHVLCCIAGAIRVRDETLRPGEFALLPAALGDYTLTPLAENTAVLQASVPAPPGSARVS